MQSKALYFVFHTKLLYSNTHKNLNNNNNNNNNNNSDPNLTTQAATSALAQAALMELCSIEE